MRAWSKAAAAQLTAARLPPRLDLEVPRSKPLSKIFRRLRQKWKAVLVGDGGDGGDGAAVHLYAGRKGCASPSVWREDMHGAKLVEDVVQACPESLGQAKAGATLLELYVEFVPRGAAAAAAPAAAATAAVPAPAPPQLPTETAAALGAAVGAPLASELRVAGVEPLPADDHSVLHFGENTCMEILRATDATNRSMPPPPAVAARPLAAEVSAAALPPPPMRKINVLQPRKKRPRGEAPRSPAVSFSNSPGIQRAAKAPEPAANATPGLGANQGKQSSPRLESRGAPPSTLPPASLSSPPTQKQGAHASTPEANVADAYSDRPTPRALVMKKRQRSQISGAAGGESASPGRRQVSAAAAAPLPSVRKRRIRPTFVCPLPLKYVEAAMAMSSSGGHTGFSSSAFEMQTHCPVSPAFAQGTAAGSYFLGLPLRRGPAAATCLPPEREAAILRGDRRRKGCAVMQQAPQEEGPSPVQPSSKP
uniref:Uncharacterized protein n=1 Tax=Phaeomonas parva TaxID=124430 RepID=A0A7S1UK54_9STRA